MNSKRTKIAILLILGFALPSLWAESARNPRDNEDLKFIREWQRDQKMRALASQLALTPEQVSAFRGLKERVDALNADYAIRLESVENELAEAAKQVRQRLESGEVLGPSDQAALKSSRSRWRVLQKEKRLKLGLLALDLENILTEPQKRLLRTKARDSAGRRASSGRGASLRRKAARLLLSEAFLNQFSP